MKSKMSFINSGLIVINIKRFWWVSVLYFIGLSILLPLRMIQFSIAYNTDSSALSSISALVSSVNMFGIFLWIAPILIGLLMVIYMHRPKIVAIPHVLLSSRTILLINQIISGLILIFPPLILSGIILIVRNLTTILREAYTIPQVLLVIAFIMLFETVVFSSTIFIGKLLIELKIPFINIGLIMSNIKRFWWISALYFIGLTILLPLRLLQPHNINETIMYYSGPVSFSPMVAYANEHGYFLCIVPILFGVLMFTYIHKSKAETKLHALSFSRTTLFSGQIISGLLLMLTPVILNGIVLLILYQATFLNEIYTIPQVLMFTGYIVLFETLVFSITIFIGMLTGNSIAHFILTYLFNLVPIAIYYILTSFLSNMLVGFTILNSAFFDAILLNAPLIKGFSIFGEAYSYGPLINRFEAKVSTIEVIVYICCTLLFIGVSLLLCKKRKLETATDIISFKVIRQIFKYGITFAFMLIGSVFIISIKQIVIGENPMDIINKSAPDIPSLLICSLIGYCIAEMLLRKSFNIWRSYKGFVVYSVVIVALFLMVSNDVFGFVNKVPDVNDVQSVYLGDKYRWEQKVNPDTYNTMPSEYTGTTFTEPKNIEYIEKLHKQFIENEKSRYNKYLSNEYYSQFYIIYTLKNGSQLVRSYQLNAYYYLEPLLSSSEYKLKNKLL